MTDLLEKCLELAIELGISEETAKTLARGILIVSILGITWGLVRRAIRFVQERIAKNLARQRLAPFFYPEELIAANRYFIPTRAQDFPTDEPTDPDRRFAWIASYRLIPKLLKRAFRAPELITENTHKYYLVLADSGMGKSTFMLNLYQRFYRQIVFGRYEEIYLFPLGHPQTLPAVAAIENKQSAILLLDALDEDAAAMDNYAQRITEILTTTAEFWRVVITCRTQFFPSQTEEPHGTGIFRYGPQGGELFFRKLYISPFDRRDVRRYLNMRFPWYKPWLWKKKNRAKKIVKQSPDLVFRPMILSFIQDLVAEEKTYDYLFQMYEVIIRKWIEREAGKPNIRKKYPDTDRFQESLYHFSKAIAVDMYLQRKERGGLFLPNEDPLLRDEIVEDLGLRAPLSGQDKRGRSLLNRNAQGQFRFAHRSILEYFLALEAYHNIDFYQQIDATEESFGFVNKFLPDMELALPNSR